MAKFRDLISSFLAGEITPKAWGRADSELWKQACERIENMIVHPQGGASRRPGTQFKYDLTSGDDPIVSDTAPGVRYIPFIISRTEAYIVVLSSKLSSSDYNPNTRGVYLWDINDESFVTLTNSYTSAAYTQFFGYNSQAQLNEVHYAQFGNAMFFAQGNRIPWALEKRGSSFFFMPFWAYGRLGEGGTLVNSEVAIAWPYRDRNTSATTLTANVVAAATLSMSANIGNAMIGSMIRATGDSDVTTGAALVTAAGAGAPQSLTVSTLVNFEDTNATSNWALSSWNNTDGWPRTVTFYEGRIWYGGSAVFPNTFWSSRAGSLADMRQLHWQQDSPNTVTNDDPFSGTIASPELNTISWMSAGKTLAIGTIGREHLAFGPDVSEVIGALNSTFPAESAAGGKGRVPVRLDNAVLFIQNSGRRIREFLFNDAQNSYKATDITVYAEHMPRRVTEDLDLTDTTYFLEPEIEQMALQKSDDQVIWCIDRNGGLFAFTRDTERQVNAFHYHRIGGVWNDGLQDRAPYVLSVCVAPSPSGAHDDVYVAVLRTVDGSDVVYMEKMGRSYEFATPNNNSTDLDRKMVFADSTVLFSGSAATAITGLGHLEGQEVHAIADGFYKGTFTVASGQITLPIAADKVVVGLGYRSYLRLMNLNLGSVIGTAQMAPRSVNSLMIRFVGTLGAKYGPSLDRLDSVNFQDPNLAMNTPLNLFTGDKKVTFQEGWQDKLNIHIVQDLPLPMHVDCVVAKGILND